MIRKQQSWNQSGLFGKIGIGVVKYEVCANLRQKPFFQVISTVQTRSRMISYSRKSQKLKEEIVKIQKTNRVFTFIEQIEEQTLLITGGSSPESRRFTIFSQNDTKNFLMQNQRFFHRTNFNKKHFIYIISGGTEECEIFNRNNNNFKSIKDIQSPTGMFGCDQNDQTLNVFGGYNQYEYIAKDQIQAYDIYTDSWNICEQKLTCQASTSAINVPQYKLFLIYANYSTIETQIFDQKRIIIQGEKYPRAQCRLDFTKPILSGNQVYQYNYESQLYVYDLSNEKWALIL